MTLFKKLPLLAARQLKDNFLKSARAKSKLHDQVVECQANWWNFFKALFLIHFVNFHRHHHHSSCDHILCFISHWWYLLCSVIDASFTIHIWEVVFVVLLLIHLNYRRSHWNGLRSLYLNWTMVVVLVSVYIKHAHFIIIAFALKLMRKKFWIFNFFSSLLFFSCTNATRIHVASSCIR